MAISVRTNSIAAAQRQDSAQRKADGWLFLWRCISLIALIAATVGVATVIARWTNSREPVGRWPSAIQSPANGEG